MFINIRNFVLNKKLCLPGIIKYNFFSLQQIQPKKELDKLYKWIKLECRSNDKAVLNSYEFFTKEAARNLGIKIISTESPLFPKIEKQICLRSAHVHKKHRETYEWRTYEKIITFGHLTGSTADTFLHYIELNIPEGVMLIVEKNEIKKIPSHLKPPNFKE